MRFEISDCIWFCLVHSEQWPLCSLRLKFEFARFAQLRHSNLLFRISDLSCRIRPISNFCPVDI
jgi:hypothetical protein